MRKSLGSSVALKLYFHAKYILKPPLGGQNIGLTTLQK